MFNFTSECRSKYKKYVERFICISFAWEVYLISGIITLLIISLNNNNSFVIEFKGNKNTRTAEQSRAHKKHGKRKEAGENKLNIWWKGCMEIPKANPFTSHHFALQFALFFLFPSSREWTTVLFFFFFFHFLPSLHSFILFFFFFFFLNLGFGERMNWVEKKKKEK